MISFAHMYDMTLFMLTDEHAALRELYTGSKGRGVETPCGTIIVSLSQTHHTSTPDSLAAFRFGF